MPVALPSRYESKRINRALLAYEIQLRHRDLRMFQDIDHSGQQLAHGAHHVRPDINRAQIQKQNQTKE